MSDLGGVAIVAGSGLLILWCERVAGKRRNVTGRRSLCRLSGKCWPKVRQGLEIRFTESVSPVLIV